MRTIPVKKAIASREYNIFSHLIRCIYRWILSRKMWWCSAVTFVAPHHLYLELFIAFAHACKIVRWNSFRHTIETWHFGQEFFALSSSSSSSSMSLSMFLKWMTHFIIMRWFDVCTKSSPQSRSLMSPSRCNI